MKTEVKIPRRFFDDHRDRVAHAPLPQIIRETNKHYFISSDDRGIYDLLSDAEYYAELSIHDSDAWLFGVIRSASATLKALKSQLPLSVLKNYYKGDWAKNPKFCYCEPPECQQPTTARIATSQSTSAKSLAARAAKPRPWRQGLTPANRQGRAAGHAAARRNRLTIRRVNISLITVWFFSSPVTTTTKRPGRHPLLPRWAVFFVA